MTYPFLSLLATQSRMALFGSPEWYPFDAIENVFRFTRFWIFRNRAFRCSCRQVIDNIAVIYGFAGSVAPL